MFIRNDFHCILNTFSGKLFPLIVVALDPRSCLHCLWIWAVKAHVLNCEHSTIIMKAGERIKRRAKLVTYAVSTAVFKQSHYLCKCIHASSAVVRIYKLFKPILHYHIVLLDKIHDITDCRNRGHNLIFAKNFLVVFEHSLAQFVRNARTTVAVKISGSRDCIRINDYISFRILDLSIIHICKMVVSDNNCQTFLLCTFYLFNGRNSIVAGDNDTTVDFLNHAVIHSISL